MSTDDTEQDDNLPAAQNFPFMTSVSNEAIQKIHPFLERAASQADVENSDIDLSNLSMLALMQAYQVPMTVNQVIALVKATNESVIHRRNLLRVTYGNQNQNKSSVFEVL